MSASRMTRSPRSRRIVRSTCAGGRVIAVISPYYPRMVARLGLAWSDVVSRQAMSPVSMDAMHRLAERVTQAAGLGEPPAGL